MGYVQNIPIKGFTAIKEKNGPDVRDRFSFTVLSIAG
jgi:hypothetical protein